VLTPDDLVSKRDSTKNSPRDNVLFELGLFMGALGREKTYIAYCRDEALDLPTDLAGVTSATFAKRTDGNLTAALGPVCTRIKNAIATSKE
jgi:predicted nucleotide-binding protein